MSFTFRLGGQLQVCAESTAPGPSQLTKHGGPKTSATAAPNRHRDSSLGPARPNKGVNDDRTPPRQRHPGTDG